MFYRKHVFFCTNQKDAGKKCCAAADAAQLFQYAKDHCREKGLLADVRINQSGCLGRCAEGPCMVVYPEGHWYTYRSEADIDAIIEAELEADETVPHLRLPDQKL